jgi:hypothetical protein
VCVRDRGLGVMCTSVLKPVSIICDHLYREMHKEELLRVMSAACELYHLQPFYAAQAICSLPTWLIYCSRRAISLSGSSHLLGHCGLGSIRLCALKLLCIHVGGCGESVLRVRPAMRCDAQQVREPERRCKHELFDSYCGTVFRMAKRLGIPQQT